MNGRTFLFGLGVGIILGAGLLQLMLIGEKQAEGLNALTETKTEVKSFTQAELDKAVAEERERVRAELQPKTENAKPSTAPGKSADQPAAGGKDEKAGKPAATADEGKAPEAARTIVRIPPNASVSETADLLADRGLIADKQAFIDLMRSKTIRAGYFAFQGKPTLQQVRGIVTSQPLDPELAKRELEDSEK